MGVAFSGGGDSTALLLATLAWARPRGRSVVAFIVDHGARSSSKTEAEAAAQRADAWGARTAIVRLAATRPFSQARARTARHRALARLCATWGARLLLLGHTADDQAETVLMRAGRTPLTCRGLAGLAPLSPSPAWPEGADLVLARPLLDARRREIRSALRRSDVRWTDDPSNGDTRFERVRARRAIADFEAAGGAVTSLLAAAAAARAWDRGVRRQAWDVVRAACPAAAPRDPLDGGPASPWRIDHDCYRAFPATPRQRALEALVQAAAGSARAVRSDALATLDAALVLGDFAGATLAGARLRRAGEGVVVERDPGVLWGRGGGGGLAPVALASGEAVVWDGRWVVGPTPHAGVVRPGHDDAPAFHDAAGGVVAVARVDLRPCLLARSLQADRPALWRRRETAFDAWRGPLGGPHYVDAAETLTAPGAFGSVEHALAQHGKHANEY